MIKEITIYTILCDNCSKDVMQYLEHSGYSNPLTVYDISLDSGWIREDDKHYCPNCFTIDDDDSIIIINGKTNPLTNQELEMK